MKWAGRDFNSFELISTEPSTLTLPASSIVKVPTRASLVTRNSQIRLTVSALVSGVFKAVEIFQSDFLHVDFFFLSELITQ